MEHDLGASPIEAYRIFRLNPRGSKLQSFAMSDVWEPGQVQQSSCGAHSKHGPMKPHEDCVCGIWGLKGRKKIDHAYPGIVLRTLMDMGYIETPNRWFDVSTTPPWTLLSARIHMWGHVIEHEHGYRAEFAKIIGPTIQWWPRKKFVYRPDWLQHIRNLYTEGGEH